MCNLHVLENSKYREQLLEISNILSHHFIESEITCLVGTNAVYDYFKIDTRSTDTGRCYIKFLKGEGDSKAYMLNPNQNFVGAINSTGLNIAHHALGGNCKFCVL